MPPVARLIIPGEGDATTIIEHAIPLPSGSRAWLELGCGRHKAAPEFVGVDRLALRDADGLCVPDVLWNLDITPWPFAEDGSCAFVAAHQTLEHLDDLIAIMGEVWRVCDADSWVEIVVPYYKSLGAFQDPTHKHFFTETTFDYWTPGFVAGFSDYGVGERYFAISEQRYLDTGNLYALLRPLKTPEQLNAWGGSDVPYPDVPPDNIGNRCDVHNLLGGDADG